MRGSYEPMPRLLSQIKAACEGCEMIDGASTTDQKETSMRRTAMAAAIAAALMAGASFGAYAADTAPPAKKSHGSQSIYGYQMMTDAERNEYHQKMQTA